MKDIITKIINKGFFHIFGASVINKVVQFCSSIFLVRFVTQESFGAYVYSQNILNIVMILTGLGSLAAALQYGSETDEIRKKNAYFDIALKIGLPFNLFLCLVIGIWSQKYYNVESNLNVLLLMIAMPFFIYVFDYYQNYLRTNYKNKEFSRVSSINTVGIFFLSIFGAIFFDILGVILGMYLAYAVSIGYSYYICREIKRENSYTLKKTEKKEFIKYAINSLLNNGIAQTIYLLDIFLLGLLLKDPILLATYKTATLIPFALRFIPVSIMTFIYPYVAKNRKNNNWILNNYKKITISLFSFNLFLFIILEIFAPLIFKIMFGSEYVEGIMYFRILMIGFLIDSTLRVPAGNILAMMQKVKQLIFINAFCGVINLVLDIILIEKYSALGAAYTNVIVIGISSMFYTGYLLTTLKKNATTKEKASISN
ncbi:oligosaccharide flippase family protein [Niallia sp. MER 6]|uniref:oligosaccharide flippase family protein n=1 Tax=Niallia sp. MER 6 TaxID=2939567 RepID=UPI00203E5CDC|nr:oligosaccharide flippase family protein [Niallia sp. MER 6]MCM3029811.1 oligosaccharide flippase family protein [Niallia sp. MER 6]